MGLAGALGLRDFVEALPLGASLGVLPVDGLAECLNRLAAIATPATPASGWFVFAKPA
jgi:hypothetical protein